MKSSSFLKKTIDGIYPELVALRREMHQFPELAWQEVETTKRVERFLRDQNFTSFRYPLETGLICDLIRKENTETVAFRADLDALPIQDEKKVPYRSKNSGVCHACGHDVHTAIVCGIAGVLNSIQETLPVNVRFVFQPAEEPIPTGAPKMIEKGALKGVDTIWGLHIEPNLPLGTVSLTSGWVNAQCNRLKWEILGKGGHSARPHQAIDPLWAGIQLIQQMYQTAYHHWSEPDYPLVMSFTKFESGSAYNAIPDTALLEGTLRLTKQEKWADILDQLKKINRSIETSTAVKIKFDKFMGAPPVVNDPILISKFLEITKKEISDVMYQSDFRSLGGDDFGYYSTIIPAAMIRFGVGQSENPPGLHTGLFDVNEEVIKIGVRFFVLQLLNWHK
jgi:amidohydrolase